jgi:eukaryotic-like serine/threonine-protein kinase
VLAVDRWCLLKCSALREGGDLLGGKYRLERLLGQGNAGEVWEAENTFVMRRVAIKMLRSDLAKDPEVRARFTAEAQAAGRIRHPNVVDVFDLGHADSGEPFMVMELCDGETLDSVIERRGAVGVSYACELVCQVLSALNAAHALGIVHRDLKPANVMVVHPAPDQPVVKVLDFGIAKGLERERAESEERGLVFGTPLYMAPEQAAGEATDHRSDLFSVGVILFELLAGRPPFSGNTPEILLANLLTRPPLPLTRFAKSAPAELEAAVKKAMRKDPIERFQTAREFERSLADFIAPSHSSGRRTTTSDVPLPLIARDPQVPRPPATPTFPPPAAAHDSSPPSSEDDRITPDAPPQSVQRGRLLLVVEGTDPPPAGNAGKLGE